MKQSWVPRWYTEWSNEVLISLTEEKRQAAIAEMFNFTIDDAYDEVMG